MYAFFAGSYIMFCVFCWLLVYISLLESTVGSLFAFYSSVFCSSFLSCIAHRLVISARCAVERTNSGERVAVRRMRHQIFSIIWIVFARSAWFCCSLSLSLTHSICLPFLPANTFFFPLRFLQAARISHSFVSFPGFLSILVLSHLRSVRLCPSAKIQQQQQQQPPKNVHTTEKEKRREKNWS